MGGKKRPVDKGCGHQKNVLELVVSVVQLVNIVKPNHSLRVWIFCHRNKNKIIQFHTVSGNKFQSRELTEAAWFVCLWVGVSAWREAKGH